MRFFSCSGFRLCKSRLTYQCYSFIHSIPLDFVTSHNSLDCPYGLPSYHNSTQVLLPCSFAEIELLSDIRPWNSSTSSVIALFKLMSHLACTYWIRLTADSCPLQDAMRKVSWVLVTQKFAPGWFPWTQCLSSRWWQPQWDATILCCWQTGVLCLLAATTSQASVAWAITQPCCTRQAGSASRREKLSRWVQVRKNLINQACTELLQCKEEINTVWLYTVIATNIS